MIDNFISDEEQLIYNEDKMKRAKRIKSKLQDRFRITYKAKKLFYKLPHSPKIFKRMKNVRLVCRQTNRKERHLIKLALKQKDFETSKIHLKLPYVD